MGSSFFRSSFSGKTRHSSAAHAAQLRKKDRRRPGDTRVEDAVRRDALDDGQLLLDLFLRHELIEEPILEFCGKLLALLLVPTLLPVYELALFRAVVARFALGAVLAQCPAGAESHH